MQTAFNIPQSEHDALLALLRLTEARGGYVQVKFLRGHCVTLMRSGRVVSSRPGLLRDTTVAHANIDTWLASLNA